MWCVQSKGFISVDSLLALALIGSLTIILVQILPNKNTLSIEKLVEPITILPNNQNVQIPFRCFGDFSLKVLDGGEYENITHMWQRGDILIASLDSTTLSHDDIRIYQKSTQDDWDIKAQLNFGPGSRAFDVVGPYIIAGNTSVNNHLTLIDVLNTGSGYSLAIRNTLNLPRDRATSTPIVREVVHMGGGYVAVGTEKWDGPELSIVRVEQDGTMTVVYLHEVNSVVSKIIASDTYLIVGTGGVYEILLFDITAPSSPVLKDSVSFPGYGTHDVLSLTWIATSTFAVGRSVGGFNVVHEPELIIAHIEKENEQVRVEAIYDTGASLYDIRSHENQNEDARGSEKENGHEYEYESIYTLVSNKNNFGVRDVGSVSGIQSTARASALTYSMCEGLHHIGIPI